MTPTNVRLATGTFALSAAGVCGASVTALSVALSAPLQGGAARYIVLLTQTTSTVPLHVEPRFVFTDLLGVCNVAPHTLYLQSNAYTYGGSAVQVGGLMLLPSGQGGTLALDYCVGSSLQIVILAASTPASATVVSGSITLWRV